MYAKVIILSRAKIAAREYFYLIPEILLQKIKLGTKVIVPFGLGNKLTDAIVIDICGETDFDLKKIKTILTVDPQNIFIDKTHLDLAKWMSEEYFCTLSSCLKLMIPNKKSRTKSSVLDKYPTQIKKPKIIFYDKQNHINKISELIISKNKNDKKPILLNMSDIKDRIKIYFDLLEKNIGDRKKAIVLLPEIIFTEHTINLFCERFPNQIDVMHSKLTERKKFIQWQNAAQNKISIMLGVRSAIFSPLTDLGLIIIDEEQEDVYHSETTPKYDTREVAKKICELTGANLILGSSAPSIETYYLSKQKKICLIETDMDNKKSDMPEIKIIDMRKEFAKGNTKIFSRELLYAMRETLVANKQVILFLNHRGHSGFVSCIKCGFVLKCDNCDVSYTFHSMPDNLICHHCNKKIPVPKICPKCGSEYIKSFGTGTQKVELEATKYFSDKNIVRVDSDTVKKKSDYNKIIRLFVAGKIDILIGTQMIIKNPVLPRVLLVGLINADISLNDGNFRCAETTFQLLTQAIGHAHHKLDSKVFIQTYNPEHYSITCAKYNDYRSFYNHEILFRKQMNYPPFSNIFCVLMISPDEDLLIKKIFALKDIMSRENKNNKFKMIGPAHDFIYKIKNNYRQKVLIKNKNSRDRKELKDFVINCLSMFCTRENTKNIKLIISMI